MNVQIEPADYADRALADFLQGHLDDLAPTAPAGSRHALDLRSLRLTGARMWVARDGNEIVGTAALVGLSCHHEELKSMRTHPARRRSGIGRSMLDFVIADARTRSMKRISLETGSMAFFAPARMLYANAGFVPCPPFGSYADDSNSVFMTLEIAEPVSYSRGVRANSSGVRA